MAGGPSARDTLQLRHQLLCPGVCARAGAYDSKRHHLLVFDARNLALRLFSLRRELKSVPLIATDGPDGISADQQQQDHRHHVKRFAQKVNSKVHGGPAPIDPAQKSAAPPSSKYVSSLKLAFSPAIDAFICVYAVGGTGKQESDDLKTCNVELIEPATLNRLACYPVPPSYRLSCSFFDLSSSRLVLATEQTSSRNTVEPGLPSAAVHTVDVLQISRRAMKAQRSTDNVGSAAPNNPQSSPEPDRRSTMLCIEKMKARVRHHTSLAMIVGSKGLAKLYGLVGRNQASDKQEKDEFNRTILVWRLEVKDLPQYVVLHRVTLQERITAMALSPCNNWLFTGTNRGALQAWDLSDRDSDLTKLSLAVGLTSCRASPSTASESAGVAVIEVSGGIQAQSDLLEAVIMTSETGRGLVYHWRFVAAAGPAANDASTSSPALELVGRYTPAKETTGPNKLKCRQQVSFDRALTTTPISIDIDTGGNVESMLLVLRGDLIHVLKVQARLVEVFAWPDYESVVSIRQTAHKSVQGFLCLKQACTSSIRVFTASSDRRGPAFQQSVLATSPCDGASRITAVETVSLSKTSETFIVCGWTSGQVEIYALSRNERVALLQDQHLNNSITALAVCADMDTMPTVRGTTVIPSSGGRYLKNPAQSSRRVPAFFVAVGIEDGSLFGWEAKDAIASTASNDPTSCRLKLAATTSVTGAHTTHIAQLQRLVHRRSGSLLCSVGTDASVKLWQVPSLTMVAYLNATPSSYASVVPSCLDVVYRHTSLAQMESNPLLAVGYDDGTLALWAIPSNKLTFSELKVSGSHERRVTRIRGFQNVSESTQPTAVPMFLSSSLDMTVVVWAILEDRIEERKYFDVCAPVVDFCIMGAQVFLAFAHEVCVLSLTGSVMQTNTSTSCISTPSAGQQTPALSPDMKDNKRTKSAEVMHRRGYEHLTQPSTPSEILPVHAHDYLSISIPSVARREPNAQPACQKIDEPIDTDVAVTLKPLVGWQNEDESAAQPSDEERHVAIRGKLVKFIDNTGSNGSVVAESLADLAFEVAAASSLSRKRVRTSLLTRLRQLSVDPKALVDAEMALEIVFEALSAAYSSERRSNSKLRKAINKTASKNTTMPRRKIVTKPSRKAIVSYNSMGEKSVRWVEVESPALPASPQAVNAAPDDLQLGPSPVRVQVSSPHSCDVATPNTGSASPFSTSDDTGDTRIDTAHSVERELALADTVRPMTRTRRQRKKSVAECLSAKKTVISFIGDPLVQHLKLSVGFRPFWSSDYCWCRPATSLIVVDTSNRKEGEGSKSRQCGDCGKRLHTIELSAVGYRPHFSARAILEIICDVYAKLSTNAHAQLFKKTTSGKKAGDVNASTELITVFGALVGVMKSRYGMQDVVELKVKQFLVSMCHFTRAVDAIAVFGELLAMHARAYSSLDEHVPHELVALCVCCYAWLYSREMVMAGNAVVGGGARDSCHDASRSCDTNCGRDHWQFVPLSCALLCAQENLMYPLVNPGFLRNILTFMDEYAQDSRWLPAITFDGGDDPMKEAQQCLSTVSTRWIEVHRFLRLIVGEWRQQNEAFRTAERVLFLQCDDWADVDTEIVEKLRLVLSCLIFYDHDRVGVMSVADFQSILRRLRYLWPNEHMTEAEAAETMEVSITFENAVRAACARFADTERDGQLCYLDFWAMLYVVGMKTRSMIKFREIPSFCRDYKLEVAPQLSEVMLSFMERSCTVLLPQGLLMGKSSFDQKATRQHVRRIGGLHDGTFDLNKALTVSFSATTLIASTNGSGTAAPADLFIEPSALVLRQSASVSAVDRFRPVSSQDSSEDARYRGDTPKEMRGTSQRKKPALLCISSLGLEGTQALLPRDPEHQSLEMTKKRSEDNKRRAKPAIHAENAHEQGPAATSDDRGRLYIQFHDVAPRRIRPRRLTVETRAVDEVGDDASVGTPDSVMDIELNDLPVVKVVTEALAVADVDGEEEDASVDVTAADVEEVMTPDSAPSSPGYVEPERREPDLSSNQVGSACEQSPLQRRRSSTTVVRVPSVGEDFFVSSLAPSVAAVAPSGTPVREHSPLRGDRHRSASMNAIAINAAQEQMQPIVVAAPQSLLTREPSALVVDSDVAAQKPEGTAASQSESADEASLPLPAIVTDASLNGPELNREQGGESEREAQVSQLNTRNESNESEGESEMEAESGEDDGPLSEGDEVEGEGSGDDEEGDGQHAALGSLRTQEESIGRPGIDESILEELSEPGLAVTTERVGPVSTDSAKPCVSEATAVGETCQQTAAADSNSAHLDISTALTLTSGATTSTTNISMDALPTRAEVAIAPITTSPTMNLPEATSPTNQPSSQHVHQADKDPASSTLPQKSPKLIKLRLVEPNNSMIPANADLHKEDAGIAATEGSDRPATAQSVHTFRFSQQPNFRSGAQSFNNPFRATQWSPRHGSGSESDEEGTVDGSVAKERPFIRGTEGDDEEEEDDNVHDMELRLSETSRRRVHPPSPSRLSSPGCDDANQQNDSDIDPRESEESGYELSASRRLHRLDDKAERALYGENREFNDLGEGIALSPDAEAMIQRRWATLFKEAEVAMFFPLRQTMDKKLVEQRLADEMQSQLRKKRQDEAERDAQRLRAVANGPSDKSHADSTATGSPNFRQDRARRESCKQLHVELEYGDSARGECRDPSDVQYFHFHHAEDERAGLIITLALHVIAGDADMYLSTNTLVPSATDYMWRSLRSSSANRTSTVELSTDASYPVAADGAHRIVLYPHDVAKARSVAVASGMNLDERNAAGKRLSFYVAVIANVPNTLFSVAAMCSGQKTEPSRAMQAVDYFIDRFNSFVQSFGGSSATGRASGRSGRPSSSRLAAPKPRPKPETRQEFVKRVKAVSEHRDRQHTVTEESDAAIDESCDAEIASVVGDTASEPDVESFQHFLEMLGDKRRSGSGRQRVMRRRSSFLLEGPNDEQREFLQDEELRLQHQMSSHTVGIDAIETEPLFYGVKTRKKQPPGGARTRALSQRLSPLQHNQSTPAFASNAHAASLRMAKFAPRPVAYSLSKLEPTAALTSSSSQPLLATTTRTHTRILPSAK